jgi:predicted nucleic acid-binding protein
MKLFVDCDVLLDVGLARQPFYQASGELLDYLEQHKTQGFIAWHSIANFFYLTAKGNNKQQSKKFIAELCRFLTIVPVSNSDLINALELPLNDFEDAMQCAAAMACQADVIISRNIKDYQHSPIRTLIPEQILLELKLNESPMGNG